MADDNSPKPRAVVAPPPKKKVSTGVVVNDGAVTNAKRTASSFGKLGAVSSRSGHVTTPATLRHVEREQAKRITVQDLTSGVIALNQAAMQAADMPALEFDVGDEQQMALDTAAASAVSDANNVAREWSRHAPPNIKTLHVMADDAHDMTRDDWHDMYTGAWVSVPDLYVAPVHAAVAEADDEFDAFMKGPADQHSNHEQNDTIANQIARGVPMHLAGKGTRTYPCFTKADNIVCEACGGLIIGKPGRIAEGACSKWDVFWDVYGWYHWSCVKSYIRREYPYDWRIVLVRLNNFALKCAGLDISRVGFALPIRYLQRFNGHMTDEAYQKANSEGNFSCIELHQPSLWIPRSVVYAITRANAIRPPGVSSHQMANLNDPSLIILPPAISEENNAGNMASMDVDTGVAATIPPAATPKTWVDLDEHTTHQTCKNTIVPHASRFVVDPFRLPQVFRRKGDGNVDVR